MSDIDKVSKILSDLIIADTFNKHGVTPDRTKGLSQEQKQQVKDLVEDLKKQVDQFLKVQQDEKQQQAPAAAKTSDRLPDPPQRKAVPASAPNLSSAVAPKSQRRRLGFKKNR